MKIEANVIVRTVITNHPVFYCGCSDEYEIYESLKPELYGINDQPFIPEDGKVVRVFVIDTIPSDEGVKRLIYETSVYDSNRGEHLINLKDAFGIIEWYKSMILKP